MTPRTFSWASIRPRSRPSESPAGRSSSMPAPDRGRRGSSATGLRTRSRPAPSTPGASSWSPSPTRLPARWWDVCRRSASRASPPGRSTRRPWRSSGTSGRSTMAASRRPPCSTRRSRSSADSVRERYGWFSVDEYQDTNPLQQRLLELWLGDRDDLCVVGDEDQTIYAFAGATSDFLTTFADRFPAARQVTLDRNYRSSPEVLALANRLLAADGRRKRLVATLPSGPPPTIRRCPDGDAELALLTATIRRLVDGGTPPAEIAVLVRINAQVPPIEAALTRAGIAFRVRGQRFFERPEVRNALRLLRRLPEPARGRALIEALETSLRADLGFDPDGDAAGAEARERTASLALVLDIAREAVAESARVGPAAGLDGHALLVEFAARAAAEAAGSADGVNLLTLHRAKGLEWDAVLLPGLEEGTLPIRQATDDDDALAEERRLLYVGLTRARRHLLLSWAERRTGPGDRESPRRPSRFLRAIDDGRAGPRPRVREGEGRVLPTSRADRSLRVTVVPGSPMVTRRSGRPTDEPAMAELRAWRSARAR